MSSQDPIGADSPLQTCAELVKSVALKRGERASRVRLHRSAAATGFIHIQQSVAIFARSRPPQEEKLALWMGPRSKRVRL